MQKQKALSVSDFRQTDTCPDCIARDDVDLLGRPRKGRHLSIRICEGCRHYPDTSRVPREKFDAVAWWVTKRDEL